MSLARPIHYLRGSTTCRVPRRCLFFDCESLPYEVSRSKEFHRLRLWTACYVELDRGQVIKEEWFSGTKDDGFWAIIGCKVNKREALWLFAHNLSFDFTLLGGWDQLQQEGVKLTRCVLEDPPVILEFTVNGCSVKAVDTLNYWPSSLAALGTSIGIEKHEMPDFADGNDVWLSYCANDTRIIKDAVCCLIGMVVKENLGNFSPTASGISWNCYRHRFMTHKILIHNDADATKLERAACHGGRCEVWKVGRIDHTVNVLDVNSLYPSVMNEHKYPAKLLDYGHNVTISELRDMLAGGLGVIASVRLHTDSEFPSRSSAGVRMATGDFTTCIAGPEIGRALQCGAVVAVNSFAVYRMDWIFSNFVEFFYLLRLDYRRASNRSGAMLCKTILNSLWGKFQQRTHAWANCGGVAPEDSFAQWSYRNLESGDTRSYRSVAWLTQELKERGEGDNSFPAVGAYVLSYGRERLRELRHAAGERNCYYCDTDSLHCSDAGVRRLLMSHNMSETTLGRMKVAGSWPNATYYGQKDYELGDTVVLAGRKANATGTERGVYRQDEFQGIKSVVQREPKPYIVVTRREVRRGNNVVNGIIHPDGWVTPLVLRE